MSIEIISRHPRGAAHPTPLLFVHGAFCGAWVWDEHFLPFFAEQGYAAHAVSLRGHGESNGHGALPMASLADYLEDLVQATRALPAPPLLVGHSMGGMVVQRYMRQHPVPGVALLASVPPHGMLATTVGMAMRNPALLQQVGLMQSLGPEAVSLDVVRRALFSRSMPSDQVARYFARMDGESVRVVWDLMSAPLPRLRWEGDTPVFVLGAADDAFVSPAMVEATARIYGTRARIVPDLAHAMMLETTWERVADPLLAWVRETVGPARGAGVS